MTLRVASNHGRFGLVGLLALAACAANRAPLAVPSPAIAAPTPTSAAVTQAPAPAGWPSAQNATTTGRPTPIAGGLSAQLKNVSRAIELEVTASWPANGL